jgi:GT2 family glycosyltransferase
MHYEETVAAGRAAAPPEPPRPTAAPEELKRALAALYDAELRAFLSSGARLAWPAREKPAVSVILVLYNRAELTLRCLRSLGGGAAPIEIIIVDNASSDSTGALLERLDGVRILRNVENRGFLLAVNQAAQAARGTNLLLLNNDAELLPGALDAALRTLESSIDIGAVGGRLILTDGTLQEAGSVIFSDGACLGYGRGDLPHRPQYSFQRDVDYCSGALLLTRRELFLSTGGFDERFAPAYYEEVDYCARLWQLGKRVVYDPAASAVHFEFASSGSREAAIKLQAERRALFCAKHAEWLKTQAAPGQLLQARARRRRGLRVLFLDDRVPRAQHGSGHPRALDLLRTIVELGNFVTVYPTMFPHDAERDAGELPPTVEVMDALGSAGLDEFLRERAGYYDCVLVSRPHNMRLLRARLAPDGRWPDGLRVLYDAEAIFATRDAGRRRLSGARVDESETERAIADEVALCQGADAVLSVSPAEAQKFAGAGAARRVLVLGHRLQARPTPRRFDERQGLLFVGAFYDDHSPNSDSVFWLVRDILPHLRATLGPVWLTIAGARPTSKIVALAGEDIEVLGRVDDLTPLYDQARVFVAPTRFATGIPYKMHHAAAHGVPMVCTSLLAAQLGWHDRGEVLVADDAAGFAARVAELYRDRALWERLRTAALGRIAVECAAGTFETVVDQALHGDP